MSRETRQTAAPAASLAVLIDRLYFGINHQIVAALQRAGFPEIRAAHARVFEQIGAGCRVTDLAAKAQMTKQSMSELVEHLERSGLVERVPDPGDGRARIVRPTARGRRAIARARRVLREMEREWEAALGTAAVREVHRMLAGIVQRVEAAS